jgi:hypothetical protein
MYIFHHAHQEVLTALLLENVEFLLIGGYAVNYHGYIRATGDMDVWLKPDNETKARVIKALALTGVDSGDLKQLDEMFDFTEIVVFHLGDDPERIDFLTRVPGVIFEEAYNRKEVLRVKEIEVPVLHLDDLILSKLIAGRPQDKADVDMLQKINRP